MKSTGVLRRIDDLGRVVIPKEIRKHLKIREGESLEIFVDESNVVLSKHSAINDIGQMAQICMEAINDSLSINSIITDRDKVIAVSGTLKKKYLEQPISEDIATLILKREKHIENDETNFKITPDISEQTRYIAMPIVVEGDAVGIVIVLSIDKPLSGLEEKIAQFISKLLTRYIEQ